jgi:hypothetical protein
MADPLQGDDVQRPVELAIAAPVQPVTSLLAAQGIDRARAGERARLPRSSAIWGRRSRRAGRAGGDAAQSAWTRPQPRSGLGEFLPGEPSQAPTHVIGRGDEDRAQLVEGGGARLHGAATLE